MEILFLCRTFIKMCTKKSRIRETSNLSTDADCRTDTILESLRDWSRREKKLGCWRVHASTRPRIHASARPHDGSTRGRWMLCTHPPFLGLHTCNKMGSTPVLPRKIRQNQHTKKTFFYAAILDHFPKKMFNSETTSFQNFSPRIPNL